MGSSSGGSSSGGGGGGGNDKPAKKATPKATPVRARNNKQKAKKAKAKAKAPKINYGGNGNQRANLPSEVNKPVRPATPIKSTAKTTPVATAKITQPQVKEERPSGTLRDGLATNKIKTTMGIETDGYGVNQSGFAGPSSTNNVLAIKNAQSKTSQDPKLLGEMGVVEQPKKNAQSKTSQDPKLLGEMGVETRQPVNTGEVSQFNERGRTPVKTSMTPKPLEQGSISLGSGPEAANKRAIDLQKAYQEPVPRANFDQSTYDSEVKSNKDSTIPSVLLSAIKNDKYRNDEVSYNQAYYKARLAGGATQAELAAEQKSIGSEKMYSGDRVITKEDQARSKYILAGIERTGVTPTVTSEKSGFFDEMTTTKSSYDIGTGKPVTTTTQEYKPNILGVQLGDNITKTFVNGVATYTKTGDGEAKTSDLGSLKQRSQSSPDPIAEMQDIDNQIKTETDPVILKALHKRRLMLMRMNRTNTRFAGLLGEADTKRTNLMSIS